MSVTLFRVSALFSSSKNDSDHHVAASSSQSSPLAATAPLLGLSNDLVMEILVHNTNALYVDAEEEEICKVRASFVVPKLGVCC